MQTIKQLSVYLASMALTTLMLTADVSAAVVSAFDSGAEGWTSFQNVGGSIQQVPVGGNPGGHISTTDYSADWGYFQAPSTFLVSASYDGTLSFDLKVSSTNSAFPNLYGVRVGLQGAGLTLISEAAIPTTNWSNYSFALNATSGWRIFSNLSQNYSSLALAPSQVQVEAVLANLTALVIAADYSNACVQCNSNILDVSYLDNVRLDASPVPLPAALPMLISGLGMIGALGWQRRRRLSQQVKN